MSSSEEETTDIDGTRSETEEDSDNDVGENKRNGKTKTLDKHGNEDESPYKVFLAHRDIEKNDWNNVSTIMLPHPKTQAAAMFLFDTRTDLASGAEDHSKSFVYEILTMVEEEKLSSWFIGNFVSSDGNLHIFTTIDPLFMILPAIMKSKQAKPFLDHLIEHYPLNFAKVLSQRVLSNQLLNISTKKISGDIEAYRYDERKTMAWLSKKVKKIAKYFGERKLTRSEASISSNFKKLTVQDTKNTEEYLIYAYDLVCDYVQDSLKVKLQESLGLPNLSESERQKRKNTVDETEDGIKRLKMENTEPIVQPLEDYGSPNAGVKATPKGPGTAKQRQLQQAAKGTHSLLKFFSAKPKSN